MVHQVEDLMSTTRSQIEKPPTHQHLGDLRQTLEPKYLSPLPSISDVLKHYFYLKYTHMKNVKPSQVVTLVIKKGMC